MPVTDRDTTRPAGDGPVARPIAPAEKLRTIRRGVADVPDRLHLGRMTAEDRIGQGTLSALELKLVQAFMRFLQQREDIGKNTGVTLAQFAQVADSDLALGQLCRVLLQLEASSVVGATLVDARRTDKTDRLLLVSQEGRGTVLSARERDALRTHLAQIDLLYDAQLQKAETRRQSRDRRDAERDQLLAGAQGETERLRLRQKLRKDLLDE